jgi:hypothetical protein
LKWYHRLFRSLRNWYGALSGGSGCPICGDRWNWKEPHTIAFAPGEGAFPTCEECWQNASSDEIVRAAKRLATKWIEDNPFNAPTDRKAHKMIAAVEKAALERIKEVS